MEQEFLKFPKMARLSRESIISEKIDGTNAQVLITEDGDIFTGSRTKWITPSDDNYGFARWVDGNKDMLLQLGPGRHFGEWWGQGIQRKYNMSEKVFSLFNTIRWCEYGNKPQIISAFDAKEIKLQQVLPEGIRLVPVIYKGIFSTGFVDLSLQTLKEQGSFASKGFMKPEGIVVFHVAANLGFKKTIEKDEVPKSFKY